jgi:predicted histone-like DNA-binding protein
MPLLYRKYKNNNSHNKGYGKWYGQAVHQTTIGIDQIAEQMQASCTVKRSDVLAVLSELGPTMKTLLQNSNRVVIPYLGAFKLGISTIGEADADKFNATQNVRGTHVVFQPECTIDTSSGGRRRVYALTEGVSFKDIETLKGKTKTNGSSTSGDSGSSGDGETGRP